MPDDALTTPDSASSGADRSEAVFDGALQLAAEQRAAYVRQACGNDTGLRERVESLLQAHQQAAAFMEQPVVAAPAKTIVLNLPLTEKPGDQIARYKLLQQIGEGGCGVVYMAEQSEPVRRRVALKVIKLGMDTKQVVARFEAERQALALMDHPNIAKVLDAGATETGRPFFVMELVRGIKITDYCNQNKLSTGQRLQLFVQICHALQHAHQKGIIHRDIKPSNILVTVNDQVPVPKVIDFGIAKATEQRLTDKTLFTAFEQFIGTPAYMSPEQASMTSLDIDTRADIYSLGVLLYELLTGQTPFDARELVASGLDAMRQTIREKEPDRPSTRLQTMLNAELVTTASHYRTDPPKLIHLLRGDLDWIVMKALEKDRTRRYETAAALSADIQRHLHNEPVEACPPSTLYRLQKMVRRNKLPFVAGAAVLAALVLGLGVSTVLYTRERAARQRADDAERVEASLREQAEAGLRLEAEKREHAQLSQQIGLSALYLTQGKYAESEKEITPVPVSVLTNYVALAAVINALGEWHARQGEWLQAATNYAKVTAIVPTDLPGYLSLVPLLAEAGDVDDYRRECGAVLRQFAGTTDRATAQKIAEECLLLAPAGSVPENAVNLIDFAVGTGPRADLPEDVQFAKGLAEYRLGHFAGAADWLGKIADEEKPWTRHIKTRMVLAMAQFQLQHTGEARSMLRAGLQDADQHLDKVKDGLDHEWPDWIAAQLLMREAAKLIEPDRGTP